VAEPRAEMELVSRREQPLLANASREVAGRGLHEMTIVDVDLHLHGLPSSSEVKRYIRHANLQRLFTRWDAEIPRPRGDLWVGGRIRHPAAALGAPRGDRARGDLHPTAEAMLASMDQLGVDYALVFHTPLLYLAQHPEVEVETELAAAFARWLVEDVLPGCDRLRTLLYLPITDPKASVKLIEEFAGRPGVAGFLVTALNYLPLHRNDYMRVFAALDERALPLGVHCTHNWLERPFNLLQRFIGAHALGTPFYGMVHLFNAVIAGLPERFPRIRWVWMEAGQAWITFSASRLDNEYRQRTSEAPLLTRMPSDYIRDMYFTTQPVEEEFPEREARTLFDYVNGASSFLYSSGYPGPDFDLPTKVSELPYLSLEEKRAVLGGNAARLFGFDGAGG
jgi:predicted TIM-barrel fold metal-dependent hydrolase